MRSVRENATWIKRFRELKATLRTESHRLLIGIDVAQAEHVAHLRHAHTRVVVDGTVDGTLPRLSLSTEFVLPVHTRIRFPGR